MTSIVLSLSWIRSGLVTLKMSNCL